MEEKIIAVGYAWTCENMDTLAPINWEGYEVLTNKDRRFLVDDLNELNMSKASKEETTEFLKKLGYLFKGQEVEIIAGRKLPKGERHIIKDFSTFILPNTYNKVSRKYVNFEDGTRTAITNIKPTCETFNGCNYFTQWEGSVEKLVGGRK